MLDSFQTKNIVSYRKADKVISLIFQKIITQLKKYKIRLAQFIWNTHMILKGKYMKKEKYHI